MTKRVSFWLMERPFDASVQPRRREEGAPKGLRNPVDAADAHRGGPDGRRVGAVRQLEGVDAEGFGRGDDGETRVS